MRKTKLGVLLMIVALASFLTGCGADEATTSKANNEPDAETSSVITGAEDLTNDHTIGVALGTSYEPEAKKYSDQVSTFESDVTALRDLATSDNLDAVITDRLVGLIAIEETGFDIEMAGDLLFEEEVAVPVQKGNAELAEKINEALAAIHANGTYSKISQKYFGTDIGGNLSYSSVSSEGEGTQNPSESTPYLLEEGVFTFAMSGEYHPFNYIDAETGELTGFDVEIGKAIAEYHGWEAKPMATPWSGIISGLKSDKFDTIIGSMGITPERAEQVDFSEPYYISGGQLFIKSSTK